MYTFPAYCVCMHSRLRLYTYYAKKDEAYQVLRLYSDNSFC